MFYRNEKIEQIAETRILDFEKALGRPATYPFDIELYGEQVLGLSMLWDEIEELPGEEILAGLCATRKLIVMNENRRIHLEEKPGRCRLTQGHEMGHWDLFVDLSKLEHPALFETRCDDVFAYRSTPGGDVRVLKMLLTCEEGRELLRAINARADSPDEARSVNRYAAAVLMPRTVIADEVKRINRTRWPDLYNLAERRFGVTISALRVRLEQLNLLYVDQATGTIYESRDHANGQRRLF
jgi:hypothetical protein